MRLGYDEATHALFIRFSGKPYFESEEVSPGIVVDFDRKGRPIAIEMEDVRGIADESKLKAFSTKNVGKGRRPRRIRYGKMKKDPAGVRKPSSRSRQAIPAP